MFKFKELVSGAKGVAARTAVGAIAAGASVAAFADTTAPTFDTSGVVTAISNTSPAVVAVGTAVLAVVAVAWGIKMIRSFLGR